MEGRSSLRQLDEADADRPDVRPPVVLHGAQVATQDHLGGGRKVGWSGSGSASGPGSGSDLEKVAQGHLRNFLEFYL